MINDHMIVIVKISLQKQIKIKLNKYIDNTFTV